MMHLCLTFYFDACWCSYIENILNNKAVMYIVVLTKEHDIRDITRSLSEGGGGGGGGRMGE
jgi:hypothetical protein